MRDYECCKCGSENELFGLSSSGVIFVESSLRLWKDSVLNSVVVIH